ncbi:hypothetical protein SFA35_01615 [Pseudomonas sp. HR96]|uniref:hypothetical protein n=1 Tax=Pseudomonas sp. HR96 TaxID=1027966 RepID=UPI002A7610A8|nr:hypothetical protein [Pseudomonas sp. HR96]WPP00113.1 hypothetical protein SFA35_01615 [Pseudomonas sp. HR96]
MDREYIKEMNRKVQEYADEVDRCIERENAQSTSVVIPLLVTAGFALLMLYGMVLLK